jgi:hypothetical protein
MIILLTVLLALVPAFAILYPFLRGNSGKTQPQDESSLHSELARRWDAVVAGLKGTELEWGVGNLTNEDYTFLKEQYMLEAVAIMKAMELEQEQEQELLLQIGQEVRPSAQSSEEASRS